ncbi:MAG: hypothetical protein MUF40_06560, partial [Gemmatimonadaceae bacterium]|nr:hypothetical protein [Gemmatimonadaceae bacterium]
MSTASGSPAELLLEEELALVAVERPAHVLLDLALEAQELDLAIEGAGEGAEERRERGGLEQRLAGVDRERQVGGDHARLLRRVGGPLHELHRLGREAAVERDVLLEGRSGPAGVEAPLGVVVGERGERPRDDRPLEHGALR